MKRLVCRIFGHKRCKHRPDNYCGIACATCQRCGEVDEGCSTCHDTGLVSDGVYSTNARPCPAGCRAAPKDLR